MVLGLSLAAFTRLHVVISLIGIVSGLLVMLGLLAGRRLGAVTAVFLVTTVLTSVTGFFFPVAHLLPSHVVGLISLVVLAVCLLARYGRGLAGGWRRTYVITAAVALYLNCFVLVVQSFLKVPALHALAPKGNEPPFAVAQLVVLVLFAALTTVAARRVAARGLDAA